jgi:hypothetical protein
MGVAKVTSATRRHFSVLDYGENLWEQEKESRQKGKALGLSCLAHQYTQRRTLKRMNTGDAAKQTKRKYIPQRSLSLNR